MTCREMEADLIPYHFGTLDPEARPGLEEHLAACPGCVRGFIAVKREIETAELGPRPSPAAKARLRRAVAEEVRRPARAWSWWERPFAFGFASATVMAAMLVMRLLTSGAGTMPYALSAEAAATSLPSPRGP